jgi:branched-chain amino acid transport system permease protein
MSDERRRPTPDAAVAVATEGPAGRRFSARTKQDFSVVMVIAIVILLLPLFIPSHWSSLVAKMLIYGLFATSLNIIWGYANIPSFGHAAFFGAGAYSAAILVIKLGVTSFWLGLLLAVVVSAVIAAILGIPAFRVFGVGAGAVNHIYLLLATIAFGELLSRLAITIRPVTGGSTGLSGVPKAHIGFGSAISEKQYYYLVFVLGVICLFLMYRVLSSHYGYALRGIHDNEKRMQALGYNTWLYKYTSWIVAGVFGGVAGVLFCYFSYSVIPNNFAMATSDISFMLVILGGTTVFFGPLVGGIFYVGLEYLVSLVLPSRWPLIFGAIIVIAIMATPWSKQRYQGLGPGILLLWRWLCRAVPRLWRRGAAETPSPKRGV